MQKSDSIQNLAKALCSAQSQMRPAAMNATNPFLKNRYADLGSVIEAVVPALRNFGLSYCQPVSGNGESVTVTTILMHESGEWIEETISLPLVEERGKSQAQAAGSVITYLRRYSLASMLGVYADEDTDGNEPERKAQGQRPANGKAQPAPAQQLAEIGFPPEEPPAQPETPPAAITLETAMALTTSDGDSYGDLTSDELADKSEKIVFALRRKDITDERRADLKLRVDAIGLILKTRAAHTPA